MTPGAAVDVLKTHLVEWRENFDEVVTIDSWYRGRNTAPWMPARTTDEYRELQERSITPWLSLVVTAVAQTLYVEGYRRAQATENAAAWDVWQTNGLDARQLAVHRGALAHGISYVSVLPGLINGDPMPVIRGRSALSMEAWYEDPAADEWPVYAIRGEVIGENPKKSRYWLYDSDAVYTLDGVGEPGSEEIKYVTTDGHDAGVCPVVRFCQQLDLDGRSYGEVERFIPLASRIDQDTFDRLVVQRFGAWVVRWIAGMEEPVDPTAAATQLLNLKISDLLVADDPDTKFGSFPATSLTGYIASRDADIRDLAAVSQTPPHHLLGSIANLSADALAAAEAGLSRKVEERKHSFGESWEQVLRLAAHLQGDIEGANDFDAQVTWRDMESRSLSQTADALGKLSQMLAIPPRALWDRIPGATQTDVARWIQMADEGDPLSGMFAELTSGMQSTGSDVGGDLRDRFEALGVAIRAGVDPDDAARRLGLEGIEFTGAIPTSLRVPQTQASELEEG